MRTVVKDKVDNAALREAFERSGRSANSVAVAVWGCQHGRGGSTRLKRALGIKPDSSQGHYRSYRTQIPYDIAVRISKALDLDPVEVGL